MNCPQCGVEIAADARFCGACGHRIQANPASPSPSPAAAAGTQPAHSRGPAPQRAVIAPAAAQGKRNNSPLAPTAPSPPVPARPPVVASGTPASGNSAPKIAAASPMPSLQPPAAIGSGSRMGPGAGGKDPFVGQVLNGRFLIETKLGQGGFGAVYKGKQTMTGRAVAIKVLHPEMARDQNLLQRFKREGTVACNLRDAHTVTTYDFDQTPDGVLYIAMELLSGKSLHDIFYDEAPLPWRRVLRVLEQMCSSLGEAHRQGIIHRDIKPENIYLEDRPGQPDYVKVLDFGIAKIIRGEIGQNAPQLTATGQTLGTLEYMSPEQLMGKQLDGRSDIYAMGVLAYELLTGHLPFPDANGPAELIGAQLKKTPPAPGVATPNGGIPPAVDAVILKMLEKDRGKRYQDVDELAGDIAPVLASNGRGTGPNPLLPSSSLGAALGPPTPVPDPPPAPSLSLQSSPGTMPPQPRPYVLAPTTAESTAAPPEKVNRIMLYAVILLVVIAGALAGVYFGVIRQQQQAQHVAPPPAARAH